MNKDVYVSLDEAAKLENISYEALKKGAQRGKYITKSQKNEAGGKDTVLVAVSSLSKQAQDSYRKICDLKELAEPEQGQEELSNSREEPWYVSVDLNWYIENYKTQYYQAVELGNVIRKFLQYDADHRSRYAEEFAEEYLGKGQRTLYRYVRAYTEAQAWAIRKDKEDGGDHEFFKVLCLCRKPKETGQFPSFTPEVKQLIKNIWFNRDFAANNGTREMVYDKLEEMSALNHWERIPSYQSVARYISYLMEEERMGNARYMAGRGLRDYKNSRMIKATRSTTGLDVMEIVQGDEHTFDCFVAYRNPNGKVTAIRPKLVAWIDTRSRMILGDVICKDANSRILKRSLLKMILHDAGSVPKYLFIDNGKDYTAQTMTGRSRKERCSLIDGGECFDIEFDDVARGFYKSIGIVDDHRAMPYEPWSKGQIERFFGGVCSRFSKWMTSYVGTLTGSRTDGKVKKDINKMLEQGKLMTMEEFYDCWTYWLHNKYMKHIHSSLKKAGEEYKTPKSLFENGNRYFKASPPRSYLTTLMMTAESVRVYNTGIHKFGLEYRALELGDYIDQMVDIRYDPDDVTSIYVYDKKGKLICEAQSMELLQFAPKVKQEALVQHRKMQREQIRRDRERIADANVPFTELNDQLIGFDPVTGGIPLMIGNQTPAKKVVALPEDRTYRNDQIRRQEAKGAVQQSQFISLQAERALRRLRAIGEE